MTASAEARQRAGHVRACRPQAVRLGEVEADALERGNHRVAAVVGQRQSADRKSLLCRIFERARQDSNL